MSLRQHRHNVVDADIDEYLRVQEEVWGVPELLPSNGGVTSSKTRVFGSNKQRNVSLRSEKMPSIGDGLTQQTTSPTNQQHPYNYL